MPGLKELLKDEDKVTAGYCPDCDAVNLHPGPQGGMSTNFACFSCSARFNGAFVLESGRVELLFFHRTGKINEADRGLFSRQNLCDRLKT